MPGHDVCAQCFGHCGGLPSVPSDGEYLMESFVRLPGDCHDTAANPALYCRRCAVFLVTAYGNPDSTRDPVSAEPPRRWQIPLRVRACRNPAPR